MSQHMLLLAGFIVAGLLMWWVNNSVSLDVPSSLLLKQGVATEAEILERFHSSRGYFVRYRFFIEKAKTEQFSFYNTQQISRHFFVALSSRACAQVMYLPSKPHVSALVPNLEHNLKKGQINE